MSVALTGLSVVLGAPGASADPPPPGVVSVSKVANPPVAANEGDPVEFTVTVTNNTTDSITITGVTDSVDGGAPDDVCDGNTGNNLNGVTVAPSAQAVCVYTLAGYAPAPGVTKDNTVEVFYTSPGLLADNFLVLDEDAIDNSSDAYRAGDQASNAPFAGWSSADVNDGSDARDGQSGPTPARRIPLLWFVNNPGAQITIPTGQTGDEGLHAITPPPKTTENLSDCSGTGLWADRGPTTNGIRNFIGDPFNIPYPHNVGPSLGTGSDPEKCLDKVNATAYSSVSDLQGLVGTTVCAIAKDSDVSHDDDDEISNFQGDYLGLLAFHVDALWVGAFGGDELPGLTITVLDAEQYCGPLAASVQANAEVTTEVSTGNLTIAKVTDVETEQLFTFDPNFADPFDLGDGQSETFTDLDPGDYTVVEEVPDGWTLDENIDCGDADVALVDGGVTVTLEAGDDVTCTFFNEIVRGGITIIKQTDIDTDQRFDFEGSLGDFDLGSGDDAPFPDLEPGDYTVSELVPDNWDLDDIDCGDANVTPVDDGVTVHLESGDDVTCTFTNVFERANLIIVKETDVETEELFGFNPDFADPFDLGDGDSESFLDILPGVYTVDEIVPDGWTLEDIDCEGTEAWSRDDDGVTVTLESGDAVVCTFTNTADPASSVTVLKKTIGGSGGPFEFNLEGDDFSESFSGSTVLPLLPHFMGSFTDVPPGTYTLSETDPGPEWIAGDFSCVDATFPFASVDADPLELESGQHVICLISNTKTGNVEILKRTIGDTGGAFEFALEGDDHSDSLGPFGTSAEGVFESVGTFANVPPGSYDLSEADPGPEWIPGDFECEVRILFWWFSVSSDPLTVLPGLDYRCEITNVKTGDITVEKSTGDDGTDQRFDFEVLPEGTHDAFDLADGDTELIEHLAPGDYTIIEEVPDGWTLDDIDCGDADVSATENGVVVSLDAGESVHCTFENSVNRADVTVVKLVDGEPAADWTFDASASGGPVTVDPASGQTGGDGELDFDLAFVSNAGSTVDITEELQDGYTLDGIVCVANGDETVFEGGSNEALTATFGIETGDSVVCTFENSVNRATVTVEKLVDGEPFEGWFFEGEASGGPVEIDPEDGLTGEDGTLVFDLELVSNDGSTVAITEELPEGYGFEGAECDVDGVEVTDETATFAVESGDEVFCTFNNTVLPASIDVVKTPSITEGVPGDLVTYTYVVTNTGQVTLTNVTAVDDLLGPVTLGTTTLEPGESTSGTLDYTLTEADIGTLVNVVVATGETPLGEVVEDDDVAEVEVVEILGVAIAQPGPDAPEVLGVSADVLGATLPFTGSPLGMLLKAALWLLVLGGMFLALARWRHHRMA